MNEDIADFMLAHVIRPPRSKRRSDASRKYTGAAISSTTLFLVAVEVVGYRCLRLCEGGTRSFVLESFSQRSVRGLLNEVQAYVREQGLEQVLLWESPRGGKYTAVPSAYIIEAVLSLVKGVRLELASPGTIASWMRREREVIPEYPPIQRPHRETFERAIQCACFSEARERLPEFRSRRHWS